MRGWSDPSALGLFVIAVALLLAAGTSGALRLPPLNMHGPLTRSGIKVTAALGVLCLVVSAGVALAGAGDSAPQPTAAPSSPTTSGRAPATPTGGSPPSTGNTGSPPSSELKKLAADRVGLGTSDGFDFDTGAKAFAAEGADIIVDNASISPLFDTAIALSDRTDTQPEGCPAESHISRVSRGGTSSGVAVCVSTTGGNLAVFRLLGTGSSGDVVVDYVLWGSR